MTTSLHGLSVLLVDDDEDMVTLLSRVIEDAGARTVPAYSADEAVQRFGDERPDVIVSDITMPGGDGYHLIRRIRARGAEEGGTTTAIALTAHVGATNHSLALLSGFQAHLEKPFHPRDLVDTIHKVVRERQS